MSQRLTIKKRLIFTLLILSTLMIIIGVLGQIGLQNTNDGFRTVYEDRLLPLKELDLIARAILLTRISNANAIISDDPEKIHSLLMTMSENINIVKKNWNLYLASYLTPEEKNLAQQFFNNYQRFEQEGINASMDNLRKGDIPAAKNILETKIRPLFVPVHDGIDSLIKINIDEAEREYQRSKQRYNNFMLISYASMISGILLALWMGSALFRAIMRPLQQARLVANKIAHGDITSIITIAHDDEIGALLNDCAIMQNSLQEFVKAQGIMAQKHNAGLISARIDDAAFPGTYGDMARELNYLVDSHIKVKMQVVAIITNYAQGDFSQDMPELPGKNPKLPQRLPE